MRFLVDSCSKDQFGLFSASSFKLPFFFRATKKSNAPRDSELLCKVLLKLHGPNLSGDPSVTTKRIP